MSSKHLSQIVGKISGSYFKRSLDIVLTRVCSCCYGKIQKIGITQLINILWNLLKSNLGLVVQSVVSLTSSLVVKMLTILVSTTSNSQVFLLKNCELLLQMQKLLTFFFSTNISIYAIFNDQNFNDTFSFEQLGPDHLNIDSKLCAKHQYPSSSSFLAIVLTMFSNCNSCKVESLMGMTLPFVFTYCAHKLIKII